MLKAENVICGTTTTGTGTLTLKACPSPPGGVDPYAAFTGTGSLGTAQTTPMTYTIIEYADASFATCKQQEKGVGALLLGANIGATTLARTTPQETATGMNTITPTYTAGAPSAITIGTAANCLIFIGASATDLPAWSPYFDNSNGFDNLGPFPVANGNAAIAGPPFASGFDLYLPFEWRVPMLVKRASLRVTQGYSGSTGTPISSVYGRIYAINSTGKPGKLLLDLGTFGTNPLNASGNISTGLHSTGFMLLPGEYFFDVAQSWSGATGTVVQALLQTLTNGNVLSFRMGTNAFAGIGTVYASGATLGAAPDPANIVGYTYSGPWFYIFSLNAT